MKLAIIIILQLSLLGVVALQQMEIQRLKDETYIQGDLIIQMGNHLDLPQKSFLDGVTHIDRRDGLGMVPIDE